MSGAKSGLAYNPSAIDPYQVENTLAQQASDPQKQGVAMALLQAYSAERNQQARTYAGQLDIQRALVQQQLNNEQMKTAGELINSGVTSGATPLLMGSAATGSIYGGVDPRVGALYQQLAANKLGSANLEAAGKGAHELASAGFAPAIGPLSGMAGLPLSPDTPLGVKTAAANDKVTFTGIDPNTGMSGSFTTGMGNAPIARALATQLQTGGGSPGTSAPPSNASLGSPVGLGNAIPNPQITGEPTPTTAGTARDQGSVPGSQVARANQWMSDLRSSSDPNAQRAYQDMIRAAEAGSPIIVKGTDPRTGKEVYGVKGATQIHWMV